MAKRSLRAALDAREFFVAPGAQDMLAALLINRIGFDFVYGSGYWMAASAYGLPDAGIATYTQMLDRMTTLAVVADATLIADADTGYGGLLNVRHTIAGYEAAGIAGIQIEDQVFPKRCGHTRGKQVIPTADMVQKIEVACAARRDPVETLIIARTDAVAIEGFDAALRRIEAYAKAGADVLFVEALGDEAMMAEACASVDMPMVANMADGGGSPILDAKTLQDIGYAFAIFPAMCSLHALAAMEAALVGLKTHGTSTRSGREMFSFSEFCSMIGFDEIYAFDAQWAQTKLDG